MHRLDVVEHANTERLHLVWHVTSFSVYLSQIAKLVVDVEQAVATTWRSSVLTRLLLVVEILIVESTNETGVPLHVVVLVSLLKAHALLKESILLLFELCLPVEAFESHVNLRIAHLVLVVIDFLGEVLLQRHFIVADA